MKQLHLGLTLFALVLWGGDACAEEAVELPDQEVRSEALFASPDVSESWSFDLPPLETPAQVSVIPASLLEAQGARTLSDALWNSAGVTTGTGNGIHDYFVIRGVDSLNGGLVLIDGIPEPESTIYPMPLYREIHVVKGPAAFAHGANSLAGSVNLLRKRPGDEESTHLKVTAGSHDLYRGVVDATRFMGDNAAVRGSALLEDSESYRDGIESEVFALSPSLHIAISDKSQLALHYDFLSSEVTPDAGIPVLGSSLVVDSRSASFNLPGDRSEQDVHRFLAEYTYQVSDDAELSYRAFVTSLDWESDGTILAGFPLFVTGMEASPSTLARLRGVLDDEQELYGDELEFSTSVDIGETTHDVTLGVEYMRFTDEFTILIEPATAVDLASGFTFPLAFPPIPPNTGDAESDIYSAYIHDQVALDDQWSIVAGGRVDYLDFEDNARGSSRTDTEFSPFGGIIVRANENTSLYVNGGLGFAPPSTQVLGPRGKPETSTHMEAGVKVQGERWFCQASVYQLERDDIAIPESSGLFSRNGSQESRGAELEIQGELAPGLRVLAAYGYLDSELETFTEFFGPFLVDQSGNTAPFAPEHTLRVWASLDLSEQMGLGIGVRALSDQYIAADNVFEIESYATLDAAIIYTREDWTLSIHARNLSGEDFATRGTGNTSIIPGDDLSATATLAITL